MAKSTLRFKVLSVALGLLVPLVFLEIGVRLFGGTSTDTAPWLGETSLKRELQYAVKVREPKPVQNPITATVIPSRPAEYPRGYSLLDPILGVRANPNQVWRVKQFAEDGSVNYEVEYRFDEFSRRRSKGQDDPARKVPFVVLGCSFAIGEGLHEHETLASQVAERALEYRPLNYAYHGWGPGNSLRRVRMPDFGMDFERDARAKTVYLYMDDHLNRMMGSLKNYRAGFGWEKFLPDFRLEGDRLVDKGMFSYSDPFRDLAMKVLSKWRSLHFLGINWPLRYSDSEYRLFAAIMREIRDVVRERTGGEFYVVMYPGSAGGPYLVPHLDEMGVATVDYSSYRPSKFTEVSAILPDGHPSAAAIRFLAKRLAIDLQIHSSEKPFSESK